MNPVALAGQLLHLDSPFARPADKGLRSNVENPAPNVTLTISTGIAFSDYTALIVAMWPNAGPSPDSPNFREACLSHQPEEE